MKDIKTIISELSDEQISVILHFMALPYGALMADFVKYKADNYDTLYELMFDEIRHRANILEV